MDLYEAMLGFVLLLLLFVSTSQGSDFLRGVRSKDRRKIAQSDAMSNVRITDAVSNIQYRPRSLLEDGDDKFTLDVETVRGTRTQEMFSDLRESDFKHSVKDSLVTGRIHYRLFRDVIAKKEDLQEVVEIHPKYTNDELQEMSKEAFLQKTLLEGQIMDLKANKEEDIDNAVDRTLRLTASKYQGGQNSGGR